MDHSALMKLTHGKGLSSRMVRYYLKLAEFIVFIEHRADKENVVANKLSHNPQEGVEAAEEVKICVL